MKGNIQRRYTMERLMIFPNNQVPKEIMENISNEIPLCRPVPIRLDHIPEEEVKNFPKIMEYPENYVLK